MNWKDKIKKARTQLLLKHPFFGNLACSLKTEEKEIPFPMGTNGKSIYYNTKLLEELELDTTELEAVIAHEIMHLVLAHPWRKESRNQRKWNIAADAAINPLLDEWGFNVPNFAISEEEYEEMSAEKIYEDLPAIEEHKCPKCDSSNVKKKKLIVKDKIKGSETFEAEGKFLCKDCGHEWSQKIRVVQGQKLSGIPLDDHDLWDEIEAEKTKWERKVKKAANSAKMHGDLPKGLERIVKNIKNPKIDWKRLLRRYILSHDRNEYTWNKPNRRWISRGIYFPALKSERLNVGVAVDTSGSVKYEQLRDFISEVAGILNAADNFRAELIACDADVHAHERARTKNELHRFIDKCEGGGGTDFRPVFEELEGGEIECLIYLTDGRGDYPENPPKYDVIWTLNKELPTDYEIPFGRKIVMNSQSMRRRHSSSKSLVEG